MTTNTSRLVAVVEDEPTIREGICFALGPEGYRSESFGDGLSAWEAVERTLPDLAVLDIGVPRMDGLEFRTIDRGCEGD